jgi:hypothetical protein
MALSSWNAKTHWRHTSNNKHNTLFKKHQTKNGVWETVKLKVPKSNEYPRDIHREKW